MPNHVTNIITIKSLNGTDLSEVYKSLLNDDGYVDFNVIKERPSCLDDFEPCDDIIKRAQISLGVSKYVPSGELHEAIERMEIANKIKLMKTPASDSDIVLILRAISNYRECGEFYWYDWQRKNWGTKWNAYGQEKHDTENLSTVFKFETAWSHPAILIEALSSKLPEVLFFIEFADEDIGSNCGSYEIKGGAILNSSVSGKWSEMSKEEQRGWRKFAFNLCYPEGDKSEFGYDSNWDTID